MYLKSYKELIVWQKGIQLVIEIYLVTDKFPKTEVYGLTSQLRRAAVSIPSNIAEGYVRRSAKEYSHALAIAYGSAVELETQLIIAKKLKFATETDFQTIERLLDEVLRMLNKMTSQRKEAGAKSKGN
jgi:four helix bundle protein